VSLDAALLERVLASRIRRASVDERRRLGALWIDRAIRTHLAGVYGDHGSLDAAALARTGPAVDADATHAALAHLARISSSHPRSTALEIDFDGAVAALSVALDLLRNRALSADDLVKLRGVVADALACLGKDRDDDLPAAVDDTGGWSDA
jgi:hypothetical protein